MNITVYTINDCKFSQAEKDFLNSKKISFKEKNLESNREFLTEMLQVSNNFAGTPVTKIEKDDGETVILKGFTPEEFDKALGTTTASSGVMPPVMQAATAAGAAAASTPTPPEAPVDMSAPAPVVPSPEPVPSSAANLNDPTATQPPSVDPILNNENTESPAQPDPMSQPAPAAQTPASDAQAPAPKADDGGIISLSSDMPVQKEPVQQPEPVVPPTSAPQAPTQPTDVPQPETPAQPTTPTPVAGANPDDQLSSVLQNLQSQVNSGPGEEEPQNQPKA